MKTLTDRELYKPGNIIWSHYWRHYNLVRDVEFEADGRLHRVKVQHCTREGLPLDEARWHGTSASAGDRVAGYILGFSL
jgi:hypothetical protein